MNSLTLSPLCCAYLLSHFSHARLCDLWSVTHHAPLSMEFSRQEYWSGLPWPLPGDLLGDLPNPGIKLMSLTSPALADGSSTTWSELNSLAISWNITVTHSISNIMLIV